MILIPFFLINNTKTRPCPKISPKSYAIVKLLGDIKQIYSRRFNLIYIDLITSAGEAYVNPTAHTLGLSIKAKVYSCAIFST